MGLTQVSTDGVKNDAITKTKIPANQIEASELADNAVDTNAIVDDAVTADKLANSINTSISAKMPLTGGTFTGNVTSQKIVPVNDSQFDIGENATRFNNGYFDTLHGDGSNLTGITSTTINNNADNRLITGSGTANTLEGESDLTFDGSKLQVNHSSLSQIVQSYSANNRFKTLAGSNFLQMITQNDVSLQFRYATDTGSGTEIARVNANGISFSGSNAAAESIDDYEQGTWTPAYAPSGGVSNASYAAQTGEYVKIGRLVFVQFYYHMTSSSSSGDFRISGLPYAAHQYSCGSIMTHSLGLNPDRWYVTHTSGSSYIFLYGSENNTGWAPASADNVHRALGSISYYTTS